MQSKSRDRQRKGLLKLLNSGIQCIQITVQCVRNAMQCNIMYDKTLDKDHMMKGLGTRHTLFTINQQQNT